MDLQDNSSPATKLDIQNMLTVVMTAVGDIEKRIATKEDLRAFEKRVDKKLAKMDGDIDQVLIVMANVDKRLTGTMQTHERRFRRLKRSLI